VMWLSFCDASLPKGSQFLGACIVPGDDVVEAVQAAWRLGCNPGGEALGHVIPSDVEPRIADKWKRRLLTRAECEAMDVELRRSIS
jgi:hypothetical protein